MYTRTHTHIYSHCTMTIDWVEELQKYIRIDTSQPNVNYDVAIAYLSDLVHRMGGGLTHKVYIHDGYPTLIVTKRGKSNRSILLNSHMDVVNATHLEDWLHPPFSGHYDAASDKIYGRGTQDMKSQGIQNLAALHRLEGVHLECTVHVSFVPNEEIGGYCGLSAFVKTPSFRELNVQFGVDESCASPFEYFLIFYAERTIWQFEFKIRSKAGHASTPLFNTSESKLRRLLNEIAKFRRDDLESNAVKRNGFKIGYTTTVNLTRIRGGDLLNVLPGEITASFDMRIGIDRNLKDMRREIERWAAFANYSNSTGDSSDVKRHLLSGQRKHSMREDKNDEENSVTVVWLRDSVKSDITNIDNEFCQRFIKFFQDNGLAYTLTIAPGSTDARYLRAVGVPVLGFTPINKTPPLLHSNNEFIYKKQYLNNIELVADMIKSVARLVPVQVTEDEMGFVVIQQQNYDVPTPQTTNAPKLLERIEGELELLGEDGRGWRKKFFAD